MNEFLHKNRVVPNRTPEPHGRQASTNHAPTTSQPHLTVDNLHYSTQNLQNPIPPSQSTKPTKPKKYWFFMSAYGLIIILSALILLSTVGLSIVTDNNRHKLQDSKFIDTSKYQAVFMSSSDNQVYFGKLEFLNDNFVSLSDLYYVRVDNGKNIETNTNQNANLSLIKVGNELHGPEDQMFIARDKILYWENLKEDGQVVCAIRKYQVDKNLPNQQAPASTCGKNTTNTNNSSNPTSNNTQTSPPTSTPTSPPTTTPPPPATSTPTR